MQSVLVVASAGSGKTTKFIQMLRQQLANRVPYEQIQVLMFSKNAKADFKERIKKENAKSSTKDQIKLQSVNINTIHSLAYYITKSIRKRGTSQESPMFVELLVISALDLLRQRRGEVLQLPKIKDLRMFYVDEAQDLNQTEYNFICELQQTLSARVCMVGDPKQNIYQMKQADSRFFLNHHYDSREVLPNNYRSKQQILNVAHLIARQIDPLYVDQVCMYREKSHEEGGIKTRAMKRQISQRAKDQAIADQNSMYYKDAVIHTDQPSMYWGNRGYLLKRMVFICTEALRAGKTVGLIGPVKTGKDYIKNIGLQGARKELLTRKIPTFIHFKVDDDSDQAPNKKEIRENAVNLLTIHQSKGLEFDVVLLIDPQHQLCNRLPDRADLPSQNNLLYVAVTRAKEQLHMFLSHRQLPHSSLCGALSGETPLINTYLHHSALEGEGINGIVQATDRVLLTDDIGFVRKASDDEILTARTADVLRIAAIQEDVLQATFKYQTPKPHRHGQASKVNTWDQRRVRDDELHDNVNEVMGLYIQKGLDGTERGLVYSDINLGIPFPNKMMFHDPGYTTNRFTQTHKRRPTENEDLTLQVEQHELQELSTTVGHVMEDLFRYCINSQSPTLLEASDLVERQFAVHLEEFADQYQAHYLKHTFQIHKGVIIEQLLSYFECYVSIRESVYWGMLKDGKEKSVSNVDFNIRGNADIENDSCVVELKFAKQFKSVHFC